MKFSLNTASSHHFSVAFSSTIDPCVLKVEPWLPKAYGFIGISTKACYQFGLSSDAALILAFLQGKQSPTVEFFGLKFDPNILEATWWVYSDYRAAVGDYRAAYRVKDEP